MDNCGDKWLKAMVLLGLHKCKLMAKKTAFTAIAKLFQRMGFIKGYNVTNVLVVKSGSQPTVVASG